MRNRLNSGGNVFTAVLLILIALVSANAGTPRSPWDADHAYPAFRRAVQDFGDVSISRPQLLGEFQAILTNNPGDWVRPRAKSMVEVLTRMVAEDQSHKNLTRAALAQLPVNERVRELIFKLRDQNGRQFIQPGYCNIFDDPRGTNTAAHELVGMGYAAVPQLIAAVDDPTFTRSVGFGPHTTHMVITVGDCTVTILERISGRVLYRPDATAEGVANTSEKSPTHKAAEDWWSEFQKKGEQQMLIEGTEAGGDEALTQAQYLVERYPKVALGPLIQGARATTNELSRKWLVTLSQNFHSLEETAFLEEEAHSGTSQSSVEAVRVLVQRGEGEAINALERRLSDGPVDARLSLIESIGESRCCESNESSATREIIEKFLIGALQDDGQEIGECGWRAGKSYINPRVCDTAGLYLHERWPDRYQFDFFAALGVRDEQRIECQNVWRRSHNLPSLPSLPPPNHVAPEKAAKVTAIQWKAASKKPPVAFGARIEALRGKLLTASNVVNLLTSYAADAEPGTCGLALEIRKDDDLTGVKLSISLLPGTPPKSNDDWSFSQNAILGGRIVDQSGGSISAAERGSWEDLAKDINTALVATPETPFAIGINLIAGNL